MSRKGWLRALSVAALATTCVVPGCWIPRLHFEPVHCDDYCVGLYGRSLAIPDVHPLGSINRAHYHTMQTNGEAGDFIMHRHEFVGFTAELTPDGKDHIMEIAARMRSAPFPVLIERSENNADPELDAHRRELVARILSDMGNPDAAQRTIVSPAYEKGMNAFQAERQYFQYTSSGRGGGNGFFGGGGGGGGFGGRGGGFF